jgi:hypothetical protein
MHNTQLTMNFIGLKLHDSDQQKVNIHSSEGLFN